MSSSVLTAAAVETGILPEVKESALGSWVRWKRAFAAAACSRSAWAPPGVVTTIFVRASIVAAGQAVVLQPGSTAGAFATSFTATPTSPLQEIGFVSRRMDESTATGPAIARAYFCASGPFGWEIVTCHRSEER